MKNLKKKSINDENNAINKLLKNCFERLIYEAV